ncbi:MAG: ABC transporter substrate-binding protein [Pseudomonas sp.]|nr:ABC transporter substrate-binding protein [Pseudomonas sp.]
MLGRWLGMLLGGLLSCTAEAVEQTLPAEIRVAGEAWEGHSNADGSGLAWDVLRAVFEPAGVKLVVNSEPYTRSIGLAQRGKVDAALGLYRGEVDDLDFPRWPYAADRVVALGLTRLPQPTLQTLANYRLIWVRGYAFQDQLPSVGRYQEVQRRDGIPAMLREGHADFYIDDDAEVDFLLASLEQHDGSAGYRVAAVAAVPGLCPHRTWSGAEAALRATHGRAGAQRQSACHF